MRLTRHFSFLLSASLLAFTAACERGDETATAEAPNTDRAVEESSEPASRAIGVPASDELPGLSAAPTGIAFWTHPNVAFNSLLVVADETGLASYNMEDGNEVSRVPGLSLDGVALSYVGFAGDAAGLAAAYDTQANSFRFYGIDNASRLFLPLTGGPAMRGPLRDFCLGRADRTAEPTLFTLTKGELRIFNLAMNADDAGAISVSSDNVLTIPDTITDCAVDSDGVVVLGGNDGAIYRLTGEQSFAAPFAKSGAAIADIAILASESAAGQIAVMGPDTSVIELFDREDGHALGQVMISATDEIDAVDTATAMGATAANLGGLYRDGAVALGIAGEEPSIRMIPANGVANALELPPLAPANPRGDHPEAEETDALIINPVLPE